MENWPQAVLGYMAYRGVVRGARYASDMGQKRKSSRISKIGPNRAGFRKRMRFSKVSRSINYNKSHDMDSHFVVLKDQKYLHSGSTEDTFSTVCQYDMLNAPAWTYWSTLFERYQVKWVQVEFMPSESVQSIVTYVSLDDNDTPASLDFCLRQQSSRFHDCSTQSKHTPQRTLKLAFTEKFKDLLSVNNVSTELGGVGAPGTHKYKVGICQRSYGSGNSVLNLKFGVLFRGRADSTAIHT